MKPDRQLDSQDLSRPDHEERPIMTKPRTDGLYLFLLGSVAFILFGTVLANTSPVAMGDFRALYYPARCLLQHGDPYMESEVLRVFQAEGGVRAWDIKHDSHFARYIYFPSAFSLTVPFAMLPWGPAHILWMLLTAGSLIFASFLMWDLGASYAPVLSGALIGLLLANSELLMVLGNMAGVAISLCVVAVWCFLRERFIPAGVLCLAISLAVKPQDAGLVWLFFILAGGTYRKHALQTLLVTIVLSLPGVLWVWRVAPHWIHDLQSNIAAFSAPGGLMDPGLASKGIYGLGLLISLQTVFSAFRDDPQFYNPASYLVCAPLLLLGAFFTLRPRSTSARLWLALAAVAALSTLPVYHRQNDAKLLLLAVPACAMLWAEGGMAGRLAFIFTSAGVLLTGDLPWIILLGVVGPMHLTVASFAGRILTAIQVYPIPLTLLAMGVFYLWIFIRRSAAPSHPTASKGCAGG